MTVAMFLTLLSAFSILTGLFTEGYKKIVSDKENISYNVVALIIALIIGCTGTAIYYQLSSIPFTINNNICIFLMGIFSALGAMVGYDKVKEAIVQITSKEK